MPRRLALPHFFRSQSNPDDTATAQERDITWPIGWSVDMPETPARWNPLVEEQEMGKKAAPPKNPDPVD